MRYGKLFRYFPIVTYPSMLRCLLLDVQDICEDSATEAYIKNIRQDDSTYDIFYDKISRYWLQENPVPENWKKEIIPGLTMHDALSKIVPEALSLKHKHLPMTIKRISEITGLTYQQTYTQLMPHIKPILKELQVEV